MAPNRISRLVKTPKLHLGDSGLAAALLDAGPEDLAEDRKLFGRLLETFAYQELNRMAGWRDDVLRFFHFRDRDGIEVDIVRAGYPRCGRCGDQSRGNREAVLPFGDALQAVPIRLLWEAA